MKDEVQTHAFIEKWSRSKKIILPVVIGDELELRVYTGPQDLAISSYGIAEPTGTRFTDYRAIDLAVIPGVAFDRHGHRLGAAKVIMTVYSLRSRHPKPEFVSRFN